MKKITILLLTIATAGFSQTKKLEKGVYRSNVKGGETINLKVDDAGNFDLIFLSGKITYENDTIYFGKKANKLQSKYSIQEVADKSLSTKLKIDLSYRTESRLRYSTFIALQNSEKDALVYKSFSDYLPAEEDNENYYENYDKIKTIEIEKAKYLYLANVDYDKSEVTKFEIPNGVNHIELSHNYGGLNLTGHLDENNNLSITNGRSPVLFTLNTNVPDETQPINPLAVYTENDFQKKYNLKSLDDVAVAVDSTTTDYSDSNYYDFKLKKFNSYKEALADTKNNKFLVLLKCDDKTFKQITEKHQTETKYSMYDGYDESKDNYNFYQATNKDKKIYNSYLKEEGIIVCNPDGVVLYSEEKKLAYDNPIDSYYFNQELKNANVAQKFDKVISNKKATTEDFKKAFTDTTSSENYYNRGYAVDTIAPPPPPMPTREQGVVVEEKVQETVEEAARAVKAAAVEVVDSTATSAYDDYENSKNFYKLKSSKEVVYTKWYELVDSYANKPLDTLLLPVFKKAIINNTFIDNYFKKTTTNKNDLKIVDYLQKKYNEIKTYEDTKENVYYDEKTLNSLNQFYNNQFLDNNLSADTVLERHQYFVKNINTTPSVFEDYLSALENKKDVTYILNEYNTYFEKVIPNNSNLFESLDKSYTDSNSNEWSFYKSSFATLANNTAWKVVENRLTNDALQNAIHWSETSLQLEKNNPYYLDTLAQLYYLNGDRQKAIATEQMAVDNVKNDPNQKQNYLDVLQNMKEGKY